VLTITPTVSFADCPQLDVICVPGGAGTDDMVNDEEMLQFLRKQAADAKYVTSVCTGSLVLGAAGLLRGYRATTHWTSMEYLAPYGALPDLTTPNLEVEGTPAPTFFGAYGEWMMTPPPTWDDLAWLREAWGGPFMVKGVTHPDDARRAVEIGATAISVSNHGGNNLDGTPATIRNLPGVVAAVGDEVEVVIDGGFRRGSDVVKALALGARAAMIGRAYLWGLAANGEAGVANVLEIFRAGIEETLAALGRESIDQLTPDDVLLPPGFTRR